MTREHYEDTGLTPEQCAEYGKAGREGRYIVLRDAEQEGVKRLRELAEADKDGRVIVTDAPPADDKLDGLRQKYRVYKAKDNMPVEDCFVLRPEKDPAAQTALEAYAKATDNKALSGDILAMIGNSGRVVVLPCRIGSTVYVLIQDNAIFYPETNGWYIGEGTIDAIAQDGFYLGNPEDGDFRPNDAIGEIVFLTREEAEKALEAMKNG